MIRLVQGLLVVAAVHAITSFLVQGLPDAAVVALGLLGGDRTAVDNYWSSREPVAYGEQLARLLHGDLGQTLDRSPVASEITTALGLSAPPLLLGIAVALLFASAALAAPAEMRRRIAALADAVALLPPFIFPFLVAPLLYLSPYASSSAAALLALLASIAVPLAIMLTSMLLGFRDDAAREPFGDRLMLNRLPVVAMGRLERASAWTRLLALFDRIVIAGIVSILLAEPMLGLSGIGTLSVRAIRTSDPNLTVAITSCTAVIVVCSGALRLWLGPVFAVLSSSPRS